MFCAFELGALLVKAPLRNAPGSYVKPYMIRLVFLANSFTELRVRLYVPSIVFMSLDLFDLGLALTFHVLLNKVFEEYSVTKSLHSPRLC